jgi:hypothetical protein
MFNIFKKKAPPNSFIIRTERYRSPLAQGFWEPTVRIEFVCDLSVEELQKLTVGTIVSGSFKVVENPYLDVQTPQETLETGE